MAEDVLDREEEDVELDEGEEGDDEAVGFAPITPNPHSPITPLTMPTTVAKLRAWLLSVDTIGPAGTAAITASGSGLAVA